MTASATSLDFELPAELEARVPAEVRGSGRDDVRLLVGRRVGTEVSHHHFRDLPELLAPGDLLVVNNSGTLPAALDARPVAPASGSSGPLVLHVSTRAPDGVGASDRWLVEPRRPVGGTTAPFTLADTPAYPGLRLRIADGELTLLERYGQRLWVAAFAVKDSVPDYLLRHGRPIRYSYTDRDWPLTAYQTVFALHPGSAEMPSAARPFTAEIVTALVSRGIGVAPITLHTGVASPEAHEKPYPETYTVPAATARLVGHTRAVGGRVIAIGTTVVRALESATGPDGVVRAAHGWTDLVVTPSRGVRAVDGLLTGFHEPRASHLLMLAAIAGEDLLDVCYDEALRGGYLWHEFGDVNLLLGNATD